MVLWQEEAYTRTDANGNALSFVCLYLLAMTLLALITCLGTIRRKDAANLQMAMDEQERCSTVCCYRVDLSTEPYYTLS